MSNSTFNPQHHPRNPTGAKLLRKAFKSKTGARGQLAAARAAYMALPDGPDLHGPRHTWPKELQK